MGRSRSKAEFWRPHVDALTGSKQSVAAYAKAHDLSLGQLRYWSVALRRATRPAFAALRAAPAARHGLEVRLPGEVVVSVSSMDDLELLRGVVQALGVSR
jgi:hypothetical protein